MTNTKEKDYEDVILPFTLLRRIDCVLEKKTHEAVQTTYIKYKDTASPDVLDRLLKQASGQNFYNISSYTLLGLVKDKDNMGDNFKAYLDGFSENIKDILLNFSGGPEKGLSPIYETLYRKELLYIVTFEFTKLDLHPYDKSELWYIKRLKNHILYHFVIFFHEGIAYSKKILTFAPAIEKHR